MAVSLKKGQKISLKKVEFDLSEVTIGLGWDVAAAPKGFWASLFGAKEEEYDLDAVAFVLGADGKIHNFGTMKDGKPTLIGGDVVFFNSKRHPTGLIWLTGDNRTGAGDGDDEQIIVQLSRLPAEIERVVFVVQIYQGASKKQNFSKVQNAFIRAVDKNGKEICRFSLSGEPAYSNYHSMLFAELRRTDGEWGFQALGIPNESDNFLSLLKDYV